MKSIVYDRYGAADVLEFRNIAVPECGPNEALVRVRAAALNPKDSFFRKGRFAIVSGWRFPKQIGVDFVGVVERAGRAFAPARAGDPVMGFVEEVKYLRGTVAELVRVRSNEVARIPAHILKPETAGVPLAAVTALQALRDIASLRAGDRVLIHGASGGVGTFAIQLAKQMGAHVTTSSSPRNFDLCRSLGADESLNYTGLDFAALGGHYRVVFDAFGNLSLEQVRPALVDRGIYITTVPSRRVALDAIKTMVSFPRSRLVIVRARTADIAHVAGLVEAGSLRVLTDRVYGFSRDEVIAAVEHLESKRTRGKVVIDLGQDGGRRPAV